MWEKITEEKEEAYVRAAAQALLDRGIIRPEQLQASTVTDKDIDAFEQTFDVKLPSIYRAFLKAYRLELKYDMLMGIVPFEIDEDTIDDETTEMRMLWLELLSAEKGKHPLKKLYQRIENFREMATDELIGMSPESCGHLVPIGDWGAAWGPLCLDLTCTEDSIDRADADTWSLVWFDHEEFDWEELYLCEDGLVRGRSAAPDFKTLLDWYFFGTLDRIYEKQEGETLDYSQFRK